MKRIVLLMAIALSFQGFSQSEDFVQPEKFTAHNKGKIYVYWGGNRGFFTDSDIWFRGEDYNFTLNSVQAHDKPKGWHVDYVNPARMTIPDQFEGGLFCYG